MMRLIITGPRTCTKIERDSYEISEYISDIGGVDDIITGGSSGVDMMAKQDPLTHDIRYKEFIPDWQSDLNAAGFVRDVRMAEYATHLLAFALTAMKESKNPLEVAAEIELTIPIIHANDETDFSGTSRSYHTTMSQIIETPVQGIPADHRYISGNPPL